jgi:hypothetical protein
MQRFLIDKIYRVIAWALNLAFNGGVAEEVGRRNLIRLLVQLDIHEAGQTMIRRGAGRPPKR